MNDGTTSNDKVWKGEISARVKNLEDRGKEKDSDCHRHETDCKDGREKLHERITTLDDKNEDQHAIIHARITTAQKKLAWLMGGLAFAGSFAGDLIETIQQFLSR